VDTVGDVGLTVLAAAAVAADIEDADLPCSPSKIFGPPSCHISTFAGTSIRLISLSAPIRIEATLINLMTN
jgi:hypothetical protein